MRFSLSLAALAAATAFAAPVAAQVTPPPASLPSQSDDTIEATALLIQPATLQGVDNLDFGTLIASPTASGTVRVDANDAFAARSFTVGSGTLVAGAGSAVRGRFIGNGLPTQMVNLTWTFPSSLANVDDPTATMPFAGELDSSAADGVLQIGSTGVFYVHVGGTITVAPNQMPGRYSGLVEVRANFQ